MDNLIIIGAGNSLRGVDLNKIEGKIMVLNHVWKYIDHYDYLVCWDSIKKINPLIDGRLETRGNNNKIGGKWTVSNSKKLICKTPGEIPNRASTIIMAINIAIQKGYKDIELLGIDNGIDSSGFVHFYDKEPIDVARYEKKVLPRFRKWLVKLKSELPKDVRIKGLPEGEPEKKTHRRVRKSPDLKSPVVKTGIKGENIRWRKTRRKHINTIK